MPDANATPGSPDAIPSRDRLAADRAERFADRLIESLKRAVRDVWSVARFAIFIIYLMLAIVSIWLWLIGALVGTLRFAVRAVMIVFLWLSGGIAPPPGAPPRSVAELIRRDLRYFWRGRAVAYRRMSHGIAAQLVGARRATRTFWHWSVGRQIFALVVSAFLVGIPLSYVIPRPNYVQITDDNAIQYEFDRNQVTYLVHAVDMFNPRKTREYLNEDAAHLGKFNSQGVKAQLVPGRTYRLWVVGIRWWKFPRLFPNIIKAQEVDAQGNIIAHPSLHIPATTLSVPLEQ